MPRCLVAAVCVLLSALVTPDRADAQRLSHTLPCCWREPRHYHQAYTEQGVRDLAKRVRLGSVPLADPPNKTWSPKKVYWFAAEFPDPSRPGPWTTRLLFIRVPWG